MEYEILRGDCRERLKEVPDGTIDAIVTDPPYELGFMGKRWDSSGVAYDVATWRECLRVLKPGGHLLAFGGSRTYHRIACAIEDAGFEVRDSIHWIYGSGFPKSLNIAKEIDRKLGVEPTVVGTETRTNEASGLVAVGQGARTKVERKITVPTSPQAAAWEGWGTALKPAHEPVIVARKPLEGTVAANVLAHGTGGMNLDACRVGDEVRFNAAAGNTGDTPASLAPVNVTGYEGAEVEGRWPPNILLSHEVECQEGAPCASTCPAAAVDAQSGIKQSRKQKGPKGARPGGFMNVTEGAPGSGGANGPTYDDKGGASRFFPVFYCPKPSRKERDGGLGEEFATASAAEMTDREEGSDGLNSPRAGAGRTGGAKNIHPTVKPVELMRWLVRLVAPKGSVVLDPFTGSGTTGIACMKEGVNFLGCELDVDGKYIPIATARIEAARSGK